MTAEKWAKAKAVIENMYQWYEYKVFLDNGNESEFETLQDNVFYQLRNDPNALPIRSSKCAEDAVFYEGCLAISRFVLDLVED